MMGSFTPGALAAARPVIHTFLCFHMYTFLPLDGMFCQISLYKTIPIRKYHDVHTLTKWCADKSFQAVTSGYHRSIRK